MEKTECVQSAHEELPFAPGVVDSGVSFRRSLRAAGVRVRVVDRRCFGGRAFDSKLILAKVPPGERMSAAD